MHPPSVFSHMFLIHAATISLMISMIAVRFSLVNTTDANKVRQNFPTPTPSLRVLSLPMLKSSSLEAISDFVMYGDRDIVLMGATRQPTAQPTRQPSGQPTRQPSAQPSCDRRS